MKATDAYTDSYVARSMRNLGKKEHDFKKIIDRHQMTDLNNFDMTYDGMMVMIKSEFHGEAH